MFEVHLALPKIGEKNLKKAQQILSAAGLEETDYFLAVNDLAPITPGCTNGHDLVDPGTMSTGHTQTFEVACAIVTKVMHQLRGIGISGMNFEIERILESRDSTATFPSELIGFRQVPNSPKFENHLIWNGSQKEIPAHNQVAEWAKKERLKINQIVDFASEPSADLSAKICRVATLYQPSLPAAMKADKSLKDLLEEFGNPRLVSEQVIMVGEF